MPVYEYECQSCENVHEVQQKMSDEPLKNCPDCGGEVTKLISRSSFQLKGGGWYSDGYSSPSSKKSTGTGEGKSEKSPAPPCKSEACKSCPAASAS